MPPFVSDKVQHDDLSTAYPFLPRVGHRYDSSPYPGAALLQVGITLFTVSHRKSLWKHHEVRRLPVVEVREQIHWSADHVTPSINMYAQSRHLSKKLSEKSMH